MRSRMSSLVWVLAALGSPLHAEPRADVQKAFERVLDAGGFSARVSGQVFGPDVAAVSGGIDVLFPDRIHVRGEDIEFIVMGERAWVSALGLWAPTDPGLLPVTGFAPSEMRKAIASIRDVREDGRAKTSQCQARAYRFRASGQLPGAAADGDVRMWVCDPDGRIARIEATAESGERVVVDFDWTRKPQVVAP